MAKYVLLFHDDVCESAPAPEESRAIVQDFVGWAALMRSNGCLRGGEKLTADAGRTLSKKDGSVQIMDGPFAETKELLGGFMVIEAADYEAAVELAKTCPQLKYGGRIELREIDEMHD